MTAQVSTLLLLLSWLNRKNTPSGIFAPGRTVSTSSTHTLGACKYPPPPPIYTQVVPSVEYSKYKFSDKPSGESPHPLPPILV